MKDLLAIFCAFDALPRELRDELGAALVVWDPIDVLAQFRRCEGDCGAAFAINWMRRSIKAADEQTAGSGPIQRPAQTRLRSKLHALPKRAYAIVPEVATVT